MMGKKKLRLLDLKIGFSTAEAGWKGKTYKKATLQNAFDKVTNSRTEGFRLEGFDGCPVSIESREDMFETNTKKTAKWIYQQMKGVDIFSYFLDLHCDSVAQEIPCSECECSDYLERNYSPIEFSEIVTHEILKRLLRLKSTCQKVTTPQKWIGSSVGIGFDCEMVPRRLPQTEKEIRDGIIVSIFDWGRSELNTVETHSKMEFKEQEDREKSWRGYLNGIERLTFCAVQTYQDFFTCSAWKKLSLTVYDYDVILVDDFLGKVTIPFQETELKPHKLSNKMYIKKGAIFFSIHWREFPYSSRLKGAWCIYLEKAKKLARRDISSQSDPYVLITAHAKDGTTHSQVSRTIKDNENPIWMETFEIPVAGFQDVLKQAYEEEGVSYCSDDLIQRSGSFLDRNFKDMQRSGSFLDRMFALR